MSKFNFKHFSAAFCSIALLFALGLGAEAQSEWPIEDPDVICSVQVGTEFWVVRAIYQNQLEASTGLVAVVETMASLRLRLPPADAQNGVRFEGAVPSPIVSMHLTDLGYTTHTTIQPHENQVIGLVGGRLYSI